MITNKEPVTTEGERKTRELKSYNGRKNMGIRISSNRGGATWGGILVAATFISALAMRKRFSKKNSKLPPAVPNNQGKEGLHILIKTPSTTQILCGSGDGTKARKMVITQIELELAESVSKEKKPIPQTSFREDTFAYDSQDSVRVYSEVDYISAHLPVGKFCKNWVDETLPFPIINPDCKQLSLKEDNFKEVSVREANLASKCNDIVETTVVDLIFQEHTSPIYLVEDDENQSKNTSGNSIADAWSGSSSRQSVQEKDATTNIVKKRKTIEITKDGSSKYNAASTDNPSAAFKKVKTDNHNFMENTVDRNSCGNNNATGETTTTNIGRSMSTLPSGTEVTESNKLTFVIILLLLLLFFLVRHYKLCYEISHNDYIL